MKLDQNYLTANCLDEPSLDKHYDTILYYAIYSWFQFNFDVSQGDKATGAVSINANCILKSGSV